MCLTLVSVSSFAGTTPISIVMNEIGHGEEDIEYPNKGHRIPSKPIECTIDLDNHRIELTTSEFITTYELWEEDGTYPIATCASDSEFVEFLSVLSGEYQLRLVGEEHVYIGYLEL